MRLKYLPALDGIRACAFVLVYVAHTGLEGTVPGGLGVTIFFFLSGYLITTLMRAEWANTGTVSLSGFYKRRALRILPPLYLVMIIGWTLDWFHIPVHQATGLGLLSVLLYFYNYAALLNHGPKEIVPLGLNVVWSLMIEEHFYLIFPLAFVVAKKRGIPAGRFSRMLVLVCFAVLAWRFVLVYHFKTLLAVTGGWTYFATDARFDSILWGCVMAVGFNPWCGDVNPFWDRRRGLLAIGGCALILFSLAWREPHFRETVRYTLQGIAMLPIFYYIVSAQGSWLSRALAWQPLRWLGWVSYSMYLCHAMLLYIFYIYVKWNPWLTGIAVAIVAGGFAELIRRFIEKPLRQLKRKKHLEVAVTN